MIPTHLTRPFLTQFAPDQQDQPYHRDPCHLDHSPLARRWPLKQVRHVWPMAMPIAGRSEVMQHTCRHAGLSAAAKVMDA